MIWRGGKNRDSSPVFSSWCSSVEQAISAILFYAGEGNLERMKAMILKYNLQVSTGKIADYDQRTPLHLAAAEGCYAVASWLIAQGAIVNTVDRFGGTPLDDAIRHGMALNHLYYDSVLYD